MQAAIEGMQNILQAAGIPFYELTTRRAEKMVLAVLAVADLAPGTPWVAAKSQDAGHRVGTKDVIAFRNQHYGEEESRGSYDNVKRKDLAFPEQANLVLPVNPAMQYVATNDPTRKYTLEAAFAKLVRAYQQPEWNATLADFTAQRPSLAAALKRARGLVRVPIILPGGKALPPFGPGEHNQLQKAIVEEFLSIYAPRAAVLYIGDAEDKNAHHLAPELRTLGIREVAHENLPDIIAYDATRNWLFIIEAVHSFGAISELRRLEIKTMLADSQAEVVYVTAFLDRKAFQKWAGKIAWETEVWIAANPEHLIHFNGDKFLGPYRPGLQASQR